MHVSACFGKQILSGTSTTRTTEIADLHVSPSQISPDSNSASCTWCAWVMRKSKVNLRKGTTAPCAQCSTHLAQPFRKHVTFSVRWTKRQMCAQARYYVFGVWVIIGIDMPIRLQPRIMAPTRITNHFNVLAKAVAKFVKILENWCNSTHMTVTNA